MVRQHSWRIVPRIEIRIRQNVEHFNLITIRIEVPLADGAPEPDLRF